MLRTFQMTHEATQRPQAVAPAFVRYLGSLESKFAGRTQINDWRRPGS